MKSQVDWVRSPLFRMIREEKSLTELLTWKKAMRRTFIIQVSYHPTRPLHWQPKPQRLNPSHHPDAEEMGDLGNFLMAPNSRISRQLRLIVFAEDDAESPDYQSWGSLIRCASCWRLHQMQTGHVATKRVI